MSRRPFSVLGSIVLVCGLLALSASGGSAAAPAASSGNNAVVAPASVESISCAAVGECAAGGFYIQGYRNYDRSLHRYFRGFRHVAFVVTEANGRWGNPIPVPSPSIGDAEVDSMSCPAVGECAAAGNFYGGGFLRQAFVVSETNGKWGKAVVVPGLARLNTGGYAKVTSISCGAAGECGVGGYYEDGRDKRQAFVVGETNGVWGKAIEVPGTAALNTTGEAEVESVSCPAPGECAAGGFYDDHRTGQAFVVSETNGKWGKAVEVPGTATLNAGGDADVLSISCSAAGECGASGLYSDDLDAGTFQAFVVDETNGIWGDAIEVPGTATLNRAGSASADTISCPATGECAAGGDYTDGGGHRRGFVVAESNGTWGDAMGVPGLAALSRDAGVDSISCAAAGECAAGGDYRQHRADNGGRYGEAFVVGETNGTWGTAISVPGTASLNSSTTDTFPAASVDSVSCAAAGECVAGGYWFSGTVQVPPRGRRPRAFVLGETNGTWGEPIPVRHRLSSCIVVYVVGKKLFGAKRTLNGFGCRLGRVTWAFSDAEKGRVIAQRPNPGPTLRGGARVALIVSKGSKP